MAIVTCLATPGSGMSYHPPVDNSAVVNKRGRKSSPDSFKTISVCLTPAQWSYIQLWFPTGNISAALRAVIDRAMIFWPAGPFVFGHARKKGGEK